MQSRTNNSTQIYVTTTFGTKKYEHWSHLKQYYCNEGIIIKFVSKSWKKLNHKSNETLRGKRKRDQPFAIKGKIQ